MVHGQKRVVDRGLLIAAGFALAGAAVIAFVFVPLMAPATDPWWAFGGALAFMLIAMAAGQAARRGR